MYIFPIQLIYLQRIASIFSGHNTPFFLFFPYIVFDINVFLSKTSSAKSPTKIDGVLLIVRIVRKFF